jgi:DNA-directed RNA polymerase subunit M/transcription elongation factor TFIIS
MELITKQDKIRTVLERWKNQYPDSKKDIAKKLEQTKPKTEDEVADIIGNRSWTTQHCYECGKDKDIILQLGEEPDYESATTYICAECLQKAVNLIKNHKAANKP